MAKRWRWANPYLYHPAGKLFANRLHWAKNTLDEAKAALVKRYEEVKRR
jgi:hypothetical protein